MFNHSFHRPNEANKLFRTLQMNLKKNLETFSSNHESKYVNRDQQENAQNTFQTLSTLASGNRLKSFKIKVPFFRKRPFGKHDSFNGTELNFVELDCKSRCHNLYEKQSKFLKLACGRASSVGRNRDRSKSSRRQSLLKII